jgi:hypothetical protein
MREFRDVVRSTWFVCCRSDAPISEPAFSIGGSMVVPAAARPIIRSLPTGLTKQIGDV